MTFHPLPAPAEKQPASLPGYEPAAVIAPITEHDTQPGWANLVTLMFSG